MSRLAFIFGIFLFGNLALADFEVKVMTQEFVCDLQNCGSANDYQRNFEIVKVPSGEQKFTWKKEVLYKNRKFLYVVDFDQMREGSYFVYSSVYEYSPGQNDFQSASGGSMTKDLAGEFMTQLQGPERIDGQSYMTGLIVVSDRNWEPSPGRK